MSENTSSGQVFPQLFNTADFHVVPASALDDQEVRTLLTGFTSGQETMDLWIQAQALNGKARADMPLRFVIAPGSGELIGYYLLISAEVPRLGLPSAKLRRNKPNSIPAVKLAQMAVEKRFQGKGFGRRMLLCAMAEAVSVATVQQQTAFILDPVDDSARAFYSRFSFETLKDSGTMLLAMGTVRQLLAAWNAE